MKIATLKNYDQRTPKTKHLKSASSKNISSNFMLHVLIGHFNSKLNHFDQIHLSCDERFDLHGLWLLFFSVQIDAVKE